MMKPIYTVSKDVYILDKYSANAMLNDWHYLGPVINSVIAIGHNEGCLIFGNPRSRYFHKHHPNSVELIRMAAKPDRTWALTSLISKALKLLKQVTTYDLVVSYADTNVGHTGTIYKAANWIDDGFTGQNGHPIIYINDKQVHPKTLYARHGTSSIPKLKEIYGEKLTTEIRLPLRRFLFHLR